VPVSLGGEWENTCTVPRGAFLMLNVGGAGITDTINVGG